MGQKSLKKPYDDSIILTLIEPRECWQIYLSEGLIMISMKRNLWDLGPMEESENPSLVPQIKTN